MRLGFHDLDVVVRFRVERIPLRGDAVAEKLTALLVAIPIQLMNLQNRAGNQLGVMGVKGSEPVNDAALHFTPRQRRNGLRAIWHRDLLPVFR